MQIGDRYRLKGNDSRQFKITGILNTVDAQGQPQCQVEFDWWDTGSAYTHKAKDTRTKSEFLRHCEPVPSTIQGLGGVGLDKLAATMCQDFGARGMDTPPPLPKCDCGGKACGFKDFTRQHSSWCKVYKE